MNKTAFILSAAVLLPVHFLYAETIALQVATQDHPHIRALLDGRVKAQGCELQISTHSLKAILQKQNHWDVSEVEILPYIEDLAAGRTTDYVLIPVFLSREFQLRNVYIRTDRGIHSPVDLRGKSIGVSGYGGTAPTWVRGTLESSWSIKPSEITWLDTETSGEPNSSLSDWLASGKVDAILSSVPPKLFVDKNPKVARLFPDFKQIEYAQFKETRIFSIDTALAVRRDVAQQNPWLAESLFIAFSQAKKSAMADLTLPLPWEESNLADTQRLMGKNFWSYGIKSNPKSLGAIFTLARDQKLLARPLTIEDVFEHSTLMLLED